MAVTVRAKSDNAKSGVTGALIENISPATNVVIPATEAENEPLVSIVNVPLETHF